MIFSVDFLSLYLSFSLSLFFFLSLLKKISVNFTIFRLLLRILSANTSQANTLVIHGVCSNIFWWQWNYLFRANVLREKGANTELFQVRIFPHSDWMRRGTRYFSVFSSNAEKYGPEITPYLDTFSAVMFSFVSLYFRLCRKSFRSTG